MPRVKRGFKARRRRNRILRHAQGFWGARSRLFSIAVECVHKAWQYAYKHRKEKKRDLRRLWIARINAAARHPPPRSRKAPGVSVTAGSARAELETALAELRSALEAAGTRDAVRSVAAQLLGKKGALARIE